MASHDKVELTALVEALQASLVEERAKSARLEHALSETLERQAATADILKVIAGSPADVQPVFEAIADSAMRLFGAWSVAVFRHEDGLIRLVAARGGSPGSSEALMEQLRAPRSPDGGLPAGPGGPDPDRAARRRRGHRPVLGSRGSATDARARGFRSVVDGADAAGR